MFTCKIAYIAAVTNAKNMARKMDIAWSDVRSAGSFTYKILLL